MAALLQQIKNVYPTCTVDWGLPPVLGSDDVISIVPQIDNLLLVAAGGLSTTVELEDCSRHLQSVETRIVLNKSKVAVISNYRYEKGENWLLIQACCRHKQRSHSAPCAGTRKRPWTRGI